MLTVLLILAALGSGQDSDPFQLCSGDMVSTGKNYNMRAQGHVRCAVGDVAIQADDVTVESAKGQSVLRLKARGNARFRRGQETVSGDRMGVEFEHRGTYWILRRILVERLDTHLEPARQAVRKPEGVAAAEQGDEADEP
jgi:lipopolysaccharide export system protein LptA